MVFCFFTLGVTSERSHFVAEFQTKNDKKGQTRIHATLPSFRHSGWVGGTPGCTAAKILTKIATQSQENILKTCLQATWFRGTVAQLQGGDLKCK